MKTNHTIYFLLILTGSILIASGDRLVRSEYAFCLGFVLLMFGAYRTYTSLNSGEASGSGRTDRKG